jgi:arsenite methyltransferase
MEESSAKQCCAIFYGIDLTRMLLEDSFHQGGIQLTHRPGGLLGLHEQPHILDVAAGRGTSALHLAETFHWKVTGIDLSETNVCAADSVAASEGLEGAVRF